MPRRRRELTPIPPRRPRRCGRCTMYGHDRRNCHLRWENPWDKYNFARRNWENHCNINAQYVAAGGFSHDVPEPQPPQPPKTPFELACENKCKITKAEDCCICMEKLGDKNTATTACGHQFHFGCLTQHTRTSNSCPMCRAVICPEIPKKELKTPPREAIYGFATRSVGPVVRVMEELEMGNDGTRQIMGEALSVLIADSHRHLISAIRRENQ